MPQAENFMHARLKFDSRNDKRMLSLLRSTGSLGRSERNMELARHLGREIRFRLHGASSFSSALFLAMGIVKARGLHLLT
jgi:hypothetical protein